MLIKALKVRFDNSIIEFHRFTPTFDDLTIFGFNAVKGFDLSTLFRTTHKFKDKKAMHPG